MECDSKAFIKLLSLPVCPCLFCIISLFNQTTDAVLFGEIRQARQAHAAVQL